MYKKLLSLALTLSMCLSMLPATALAVESETGEQTGTGTSEIQVFEFPEMETSAESFGFFALGQNNQVKLADGTHVEWIDRLDLTGAEEYAMPFYNWLVENSNGDKTQDALIDFTHATKVGEDGYAYPAVVSTGTVNFTFTPGGDQTAAKAAAVEQIQAAEAENMVSIPAHMLAVFSAFDRDHPEVFWLGSMGSYGQRYSYTYSWNDAAGTGSAEYTMTYYFWLKDASYDIRDLSSIEIDKAEYYYDTADKIYEAITNRDTYVNTIRAGVTNGMDTYQKVAYLNDWLTKNNCYHVGGGNGSEKNRAHECLIALQGNDANNGPVCESYAKALKVLCDKLGIPCVLVDGADHMWNYVQMEDEKWYAVDVTWNDPTVENVTGKVSGHERDAFLLVGSETVNGGKTFISEHPVVNTVTVGGVGFTNGPVLNETKYELPIPPAKVTTAPVAATGLTYNGGEQNLLTDGGTAENGTMQYSLDGVNYGTAIPKAANASTYTVYYKAVGNDGYADSTVGTIQVTIAKAPVSIGVAPAAASLTYNGEAQELVTAGTVNGGTMQYKLDNGNYGTAIPKATDAGTYTVYYKAVGDANHSDTAEQSISVTIAPKTVNPVVTLTQSSFTYNGLTQEPAVTVKDEIGNALPVGEYAVTYSNNIKATIAGFATVTVSDKTGGNYTVSEVTKDFVIAPAPLTIKADNKTLLTGSERPDDSFYTYTITGFVSGETENVLTFIPSFTCGVDDPVEKGEYSINVSGPGADGNYTISYVSGTLTVSDHVHNWSSFTANGATITGNCANEGCDAQSNTITVVAPTDLTYDGTTKSATLTGGIDGVTDPTITYDKTPVAAGTYTASIQLGDAKASVTFTIAPASVSDAYVVMADTFVYTGEAQIPEVTVSVDGKTLSSNDYTVTGRNNVNAGTASVVITGKGNYAGTKTLNFTITPASLNNATAEITGTYAYNGKAQIPTVKVTLDGKVLSDQDYTITATNNVNAGTASVVITGKDNCTGSITLKMTIAKAEIVITANSLNATVGTEKPELTYQVKGLADGESLTTLPTLSTDADMTKAGSYTITVSGAEASDNYTITYVNGKLNVSVPYVGGGGGDSSGSAQDQIQSGDEGQTTVTPPVKTEGDSAKAQLSNALGSQIVNEAVKNDSEEIVIAPEMDEDVTKAEVEIPASVMEKIWEKTDAALTISTPLSDVTIPNSTLKDLAEAGKNVAVATEHKDDQVIFTVSADGETLDEIKGGVTLQVQCDTYKPGMVAVIVHEDGTREVVRKSAGNAKDNTMNIPLSGSATLEIVDNSKQFNDVKANNWFNDAVAFATAHQLFGGTAEDTFSPDIAMTRGMLAVVLHNLDSNPDNSFKGNFPDVKSGEWFADAVGWAAENGIISGMPDGSFGGNDAITREQLAIMLWRYAGSPESSQSLNRFKDQDQVASYAKQACAWAAENGILSGTDVGLEPKSQATRAQVAQMLKSYVENVG